MNSESCLEIKLKKKKNWQMQYGWSDIKASSQNLKQLQMQSSIYTILE